MALSFSPPRRVDRFNINELDPVRRAQFEAALRAAVGRHPLEKQFDRCDKLRYAWEHYAGVRDGAPALDAWFLGDDCGTVFTAGTSTPTGVVMTQSSIYDERKQKDEALAAEVKAAYRAARPKYDEPREAAYWAAYEQRLGRPLPKL